ncbi:MAG TPA: response regulator [Streptosporangiaceae bacterium]|nr:response regulator [Streptosporangiaceae bacterium]
MTMRQSALYIEDNASSIRLIETLLSRRPDIKLRVARTARDGIRAAVNEPPGLIILDNRLPDARGGDVLRMLSLEPGVAAVPVVVLSGDSDVELAMELLAAGAAEYLVKPFDLRRFLGLIDRYFPPAPSAGVA